MAGREKRIKPCTGTGGEGCWLPVEITAEIAKWLPTAASIGRFRCVSKSWYCLLSDPNFIRQNTRLFDNHGTVDDDKKARLMIICDSAYSAVSFSYDTLEPVSPVSNLADSIPELKSPSGTGLKVGGCCDGIFCLYSGSNMILWNPTTSDYRVLPSLPPIKRIGGMDVGFGYDPLTNDYKVVALVKISRDWFSSAYHKRRLVYLYSLRNDSWEALREWGDAFIRAEVFQSHYSTPKIETCYWLCHPITRDGRRQCPIASFDFSRHAFSTAVLPQMPSGSLLHNSVSMSRDCLMTVTFDRREKTSCVWSLNYDMLLERSGSGGGGGGDDECCWNKLYTVVNSTVMMDNGYSYVPAGIWEHGKCFFAVDSRRRLHVVNLDSGRHSALPVKEETWCFWEIRAYMPSPMSLSSRHWAKNSQELLCQTNAIMGSEHVKRK